MKHSVTATCARLPGARLEHPFGPEVDVWKVGGKIFALSGDLGVSLKAADRDSAAFLIDIGVAVPAPYLKRGSWMMIPWASLEGGTIAPEDLAARLEVSHATVCANLPKRLRPTAAAMPSPA